MLKKLIEIIIFMIGLSACFSSCLLLMSYASGWNKLAQYYKTEQFPPVDLLNEQSGKIGEYSYKNAFNIGVSKQGLYLSANSFITRSKRQLPGEVEVLKENLSLSDLLKALLNKEANPIKL